MVFKRHFQQYFSYIVAVNFLLWFLWFMVFKRHFQQYFSYIVAVSFIGGGNRSTQWKPPTYRKSLTNFITLLYPVHLSWAVFELTTLGVIYTDCTSSCKSNYHTTTTEPDKSQFIP